MGLGRCAPEAHLFLCLICLRESNLINFWLGSTDPLKKLLAPLFQRSKKYTPSLQASYKSLFPIFPKSRKSMPLLKYYKSRCSLFQTKKSMSPLQDYFKSIFQVHISLTVAKKRVSIITNFHRNRISKKLAIFQSNFLTKFQRKWIEMSDLG